MDGWSELSFPGCSEEFSYLCFVASHPPSNAQPTLPVVRETLRATKPLVKACFLTSILAECLCSIEHVDLVGMGAGSEIGAEQKVQDCGRFSEMGNPVRNGDGHSPVPAQESKERPSGAEVAASSRRSAQITASGVSSFQTQSIEEGRRGGSGSPQTSQSFAPPPAGCEHTTCAHVLCCGVGENDSHHTCTPTAESQSKRKNKKVEAGVQPGEELGPQRPSVTEARVPSFLPSWVFFDSGESMQNYPIGELQG